MGECHSCSRPHPIMHTRVIHLAASSRDSQATTITRQFCNPCELEYLREVEARRREPREVAKVATPTRKRSSSIPFALQIDGGKR